MRVLALILLGSSCASAPSEIASPFPADDPRASRFILHVGGRALSGSDWDPVEDQGVFGLEFVHEAPESSVGIEAALFESGDTQDDYFVSPTLTADFRGRTTEASFGLHKEFPEQYRGVHAYFGGGLSVLRAELRDVTNGSEEEDYDVSTGAYLHGGVEFDASAAIFVGLDLRIRGGTQVDLVGEDRSTNYGEVTVMLGFRF